MSLVTMDTAHRIWTAHREIEVAQKLLDEISETGDEQRRATPTDRDTRKHYQLGVPAGTGHRLFFLGPDLAAQIIAAHIADQRRELERASIDALRELEHRP